jgi:hypothetical protein
MSGIERHGIAAFFEFYNHQRLHQAPLLQQRGTANRCAGPPSARSSLGQQRRARSVLSKIADWNRLILAQAIPSARPIRAAWLRDNAAEFYGLSPTT